MLNHILTNPLEAFFYLSVIIIAISIHEYAHAWTADHFGDPTPKEQGRVSINPLRHLDPLGSLFFLLAGFGWGKPVETNPSYYRNPQLGYLWVSLAGPIANLILAIICSLPYTICYILNIKPDQITFINFTELAYNANLILFIFNLLPFYPLDGSKIVLYFLKKPQSIISYIQYSPYVLIGLLLVSYWLPILSWLMASIFAIFTFLLRGLPIILLS